MKRNLPLFALAMLVVCSIASTQVHRPRVSDNEPASRAKTKTAAKSTAQTAQGRAIVVLSAPSVVETLAASEPKVMDAHGKQVVNSQRLHERLLSSEGEQHRAAIQQAKASLVSQ